MAGEKFRRRVHDDIRPPLERTAEIGAGGRVVDHERDAGLMRDFGEFLDIGDDALGVCQAFDEDRARFGLDRGAKGFRLVRVQ